MENGDKKDMKMQTTDGKPLLTLPKWLKPDPTAGEKGRILYIEEWGHKSRYIDRAEIVISVLLMSFGVIFTISGIYLIITATALSDAIPIVFIISIPAALGHIGKLAYSESFRNRPFTIYENGYSMPFAPKDEGSLNQEYFIPWSHVVNVELCHRHIHKNINEFWISIHRKDIEKASLHEKNLTDPLQVVLLLRELIPDKIDPKLNDGFITAPPFRENPIKDGYYRTFWNFQDSTILLLLLFISAMTLPILHDILMGTADLDGFFLFFSTWHSNYILLYSSRDERF